MNLLIKPFVLTALFLMSFSIKASVNITVAADGSGDFRTITEALASLPAFNYERGVIYIKNGIYNEKIRISQDYLTLRGESKEKTIVHYNQSPADWEAHHDYTGPAVVNISGDDIVLENLTIENTQTSSDPDAFAILGFGTRTVLMNCDIRSKGGNAVSLWNYKTGMYYQINCSFTGGLDMVCPRGWCFIRSCSFFELNKAATLWHEGRTDKNQKLVIWNSSFNGVRGFDLGQYQNDAQFYLLYCSLSDSMANKPIGNNDAMNPKSIKPNFWGDRTYFYECHGAHVDYDWHKNNLETAQKRMRPEDLTSTWTFDGKWDPESKEGPKILDYTIKDNTLLITFSEIITLKGLPTLKSRSNRTFFYDSGAGTNTIKFKCDIKIYKEDVKGLKFVNDGRFIGTLASVSERVADLTITK